ncbi:hypothetical protein [Maritalea sp.]|uniref:hypothetical protein n=1 Tax=Maritalea sp. TaxID=2003361 RepID=UPI003EF3D1AD
MFVFLEAYMMANLLFGNHVTHMSGMQFLHISRIVHIFQPVINIIAALVCADFSSEMLCIPVYARACSRHLRRSMSLVLATSSSLTDLKVTFGRTFPSNG